MRQEPVSFSRAVFTTALTIVVALVLCGVGGAWLTMRYSQVRVFPVSLNQQNRPRAIEGIYQTLIERDETTADQRHTARQRLRSYGWVDRSHGIVHIPIARAMEIIAMEAQ